MTQLTAAPLSERKARHPHGSSDAHAQHALHRLFRINISFCRVCMALATMFICTGCVTETPSLPVTFEDAATFAVPIVYTDGLGIGTGAVDGAIELAKGNEAKAASRAIVLALQELETNLHDPHLSAGELLPQKRKWVSDRAPVPPSRIRDHNALHPEMKLSEQFKYQIKFLGEYVVDRNELIFRISAQLYEGAAAAELREYRQPYSGKFFVDALGKLIQDKLRGHVSGNTQ